MSSSPPHLERRVSSDLVRQGDVQPAERGAKLVLGALTAGLIGGGAVAYQISADSAAPPRDHFVPWTQQATFTATNDRLDIHSAEQGYVATFERVE